MQINYKICREKEHESLEATYLCNLKDCKLLQRWCCAQCIQQGIHKHGQKDFAHIIPWQEITVKKQEDITNLLQCQLFSNGVKQCDQLLIDLEKFRHLIEYLKKISDLDDKRVNEIIQLDLGHMTKTQLPLIDPVKNLDTKIKHLESLIKDYQDKLSLIKNTIDLKQRKYTVKHLDNVQISHFLNIQQ